MSMRRSHDVNRISGTHKVQVHPDHIADPCVQLWVQMVVIGLGAALVGSPSARRSEPRGIARLRLIPGLVPRPPALGRALSPRRSRRPPRRRDRKSTRLNSSHITISYAVFCLKKKKNT